MDPASAPRPPSDDAGLVERLRRGETSAFDETYARHRVGLFAFLSRASRQPALAEELLQETWLRFARHARALAPDTDLRAWLFTVARNLLRSRMRRERFGRQLLVELGLVARLSTPASPFDLALASETERRLELAIGELPAGLREVMLLAVVERLEPAQLSGVLGLKPDAVRQRLARARAMLAKLLSQPYRAPGAVGETP